MKLFVLVCVAAQLFVANGRVLSELPGPCRKSDPNLKGCLLKQIEKLTPRLTTGIPEYKILPLDPLDVPYVIFNRTLSPGLVLNAVLKNARIRGFSKASVEDLKIDADNLSGEITLKYPWFNLETEFKVNGKIAAADIEMQGSFAGNFTDVTNNFKVSLKSVIKRGVKYFAVDTFKLEGKIEHAELEINPRDLLSKDMVDFIITTFKQNERSILDLVTPLYGETMGDVLRSVLDKALAQVPAEKLLIE